MPYLRSDMAEIHAGVTGVNFQPGQWVSLTGGDVQTQSQNLHLGGMLKTTSLGGISQRSDCTVTRLYGANYGTDSIHYHITDLENACGMNAMWISWQPLNPGWDGKSTKYADKYAGDKITLTGTLKQVQSPNWDANSANAAMLTLVMDCDLPATPDHSTGAVMTFN